MDGSFTDEQVHIWLQEVADGGWISLHYDSPGLGGIGACEIEGGGYLRYKMIFTQPSNRTIWSQTDARFSGLIQNRLTHWGVWDAQDQGMLRAYSHLPEMYTVLTGGGFTLHEGDLAISFG